MINYMFRGISTVIAILYAVISVGLSHAADTPEPSIVPAENTVVEPAKKKTVHVLQNREEIGYKLQQAVDLYSNNFPEQPQLLVQTVASGADYHSTLRAKLLSGDDADLFMISGASELSELQSHITSLDFLKWSSEAQFGTIDAVTKKGKIYGIPYCVEAFGLICNRNIFEAAEIQLGDIVNFEDLSDAFIKVRDKINSGEFDENLAELKAVCDFPARDKAFLGGEFADLVLSGTFATGTEAASATAVKFAATDSVEELVKLMSRCSADPGNWAKLAEVTNDAQIERFASGQTAAVLGNTNVYRRVNELNPKLQGRLYLLPVPLSDFEQASVYCGVPAYWAINAASDEKTKQAAGDFLTWLYRSDDGCRYFAEEFELASPYQDTAKETGIALHTQMLGYLRVGMYLPQLHAEFPENWGRDVFAPNVQAYFTDRQKTWADVIKASEDGWSN